MHLYAFREVYGFHHRPKKKTFVVPKGFILSPCFPVRASAKSFYARVSTPQGGWYLLNQGLWPTSYIPICQLNMTRRTLGSWGLNVLNTQLNTLSLKFVFHSVSFISVAILLDISTSPQLL